jgi:hypothetical protein
MPLKTKNMDTLNSADTNITPDETSLPKKRNSYVSRDHASMVEFVSAIYRNLGHTDYHSNKEIATVHQLSPDSIKQQLTSAQQYKLLEIKFGVGYKITDLFKKIILPVNESERKAAVIESLKSPDTYQPLFKEYEFHILPPISGLKNYFVRNCQLKDEIADKTAQIFLNNLQEYELVDSRGVLISGMKIQTNGNTVNNELSKSTEPQKEERKQEYPTSAKTDIDEKYIDILIPLKGRNAQAHLLLPKDYQEEDLDRIAKFVEALK